MRRATVLLADDHRLVAEGLRGLLEDEFDLVGTAADGRALLDAAALLKPDVIVCGPEAALGGVAAPGA